VPLSNQQEQNLDPELVYRRKTIIGVYYKPIQEKSVPFNCKGFIKNPEIANGSINIDSTQNA
jgi:hypothetical protein